MRILLSRLALLAGVLLTLGGCADSPTLPTPPAARDAAPGGPLMDDQVQGCVLEGLCILEPVTPAPCDPWTSLHWCEGGCMTSVFEPLDQGVQSCPGGGGDPGTGGGAPPPPPTTDPDAICPTTDDGTCIPEEEEESTICPSNFPRQHAAKADNDCGAESRVYVSQLPRLSVRTEIGGEVACHLRNRLPDNQQGLVVDRPSWHHQSLLPRRLLHA